MDAVHQRINAANQRITVLETDLPHIRRTVEKIDGSITWAVRLILGVIILALLALVMKSGLHP